MFPTIRALSRGVAGGALATVLAGGLGATSVGAATIDGRIFLPAPGELEVALEVSVPRVPPHRNKFGRRYRRGAYD